MTTTDAIKFCFTSDFYRAARQQTSKQELLKLACLEAFKHDWVLWPQTSQHYQVQIKLRAALAILEETGLFVD